MRHWKKNAVVFAANALALLAVAGAAAAQPFTANKGQVGLQLMYGINLEEGDPSPYGLGFAPQGGYTFDAQVYLGGRFDYFLGGTAEVPPLGELSMNVYQILAEGGYDLEVSDGLVVRPKVGVGAAKGLGETCDDGACVDTAGDTELAFSPGANVLYVLGPVFLNGDLRYNVITSDPSLSSLMIGAGAGIAL